MGSLIKIASLVVVVYHEEKPTIRYLGPNGPYTDLLCMCLCVVCLCSEFAFGDYLYTYILW